MKIGRGKTTVILDGELSDAVERAIDRLAPGLRDRMARAMDDLVAPVKAAWPVKTGRSRDAFEWGVRLADLDTLEGYAVNDAENYGREYAYLVKGQDGRQIWREQLEKPARALAETLGDELIAATARILDGG